MLAAAEAGDAEALEDLKSVLDCEFSFGTCNGSSADMGSWKIEFSTLPWREGANLSAADWPAQAGAVSASDPRLRRTAWS